MNHYSDIENGKKRKAMKGIMQQYTHGSQYHALKVTYTLLHACIVPAGAGIAE